MGITGLIPFLEKASSKVHLKDIRGSTVAIDSYCWLHRGVYTCAEKLVRGEDTDLYLQYCLKYVHMLLSYDIKPILVFDGRHLPAKALTESRRRESRKQSKQRAAELLRLGRIDEARSHMRRCVDVTHEMALKLIRECRQRNVDCIVAPYEADAQMAWLNKADVAQYIITEDSDLTLFGARNIIFKLDLTGAGLLIQSDKLYLAMGCRPEKYTFDKFRRMCILSGCDYLDSLPGIGLAKACKFILKTEEDDMWRALKKIPQYLNMRNLEVGDEYIESFLKAEATFKHMYIYNPLNRKMERLHMLDDFQTDERFCSNAGTPIDDDEQALQLALGNLNPFTFKKLDNWHPDRDFGLAQAPAKNVKRAKHKSIWQVNFNPQSPKSDKHKKATMKSCALFFKKIDFISKTIDEEISSNIREDNAKPEEAEIYSMYKFSSSNDIESPKPKRQRCDSDNSSLGNDCVSPPASPLSSKIRHNPFAKAQGGSDKSSPVCENSSLLKVLSPKKCKEIMKPHYTNVSSLKRSIFMTKEIEKSEVKSRFFSSNLEKAKKQITSTPPPSEILTNLTEEIDKIQSLSQNNQTNQAELYHSPSPNKLMHQTKLKQEHMDVSCADSGVESLSSEQTSSKESIRDVDLNTSCSEFNAVVKKETETAIANVSGSVRREGVIELSDDDTAADESVKSLQIVAFKSQTVRQLSLSKTKSSKGSNSKSKSVNKNSLSQNQTRLGMFGFQKRPALR